MSWGDRAAEQHEQDQPRSLEPCALHEITNCSACSGLDKKLAAEEREYGIFLPVGIASHPDKCSKCGEFFPAGTTIRKTDAGWIC